MSIFQFVIMTSFLLSVFSLSYQRAQYIRCQKFKSHENLQRELEQKFKIKTLPTFPSFKQCLSPKNSYFELDGGVDYE